jgi:hypothetical protein
MAIYFNFCVPSAAYATLRKALPVDDSGFPSKQRRPSCVVASNSDFSAKRMYGHSDVCAGRTAVMVFDTRSNVINLCFFCALTMRS